MEIGGLNLPSRNGRLNFVTKVYRNRSRGHNEYDTPKHLWHGDIWNTPAVEVWIVEPADRPQSASTRQSQIPEAHSLELR